MKNKPTFRQLAGKLTPESQEIVMLTRTWRQARQKHLQFLIDLHSEEEDRAYVADVVLPAQQVWHAEIEQVIAGFIAFADGWVHHLYVAPEFQNQRIGSELLAIAKRSTPALQLWVFESNLSAIEFYQREEFRIVERTDGEANEAKRPDVRMQWR